MSNERTASEILLSLEERFELLSKEIKLIGYNQKILLDKLNNFYNSDIINVKNNANIPNTTSGGKNDISKKNVEKQQSNTKYKETTVTQKVFYPDGSKCILAKVRILDMLDQEIKKATVLADGGWNAVLPPGSYKAHIVKAELQDAKKPMIDRLHQFLIDGSIPILQLPPSKE